MLPFVAAFGITSPALRSGAFPESVTLPELASDGILFISGFPTGDLHPIYIAPMLGTHKASLLTPDPPRVPAVMTIKPLTRN